MTTVTARDGYSHEAFADVRQRAREQRMRVAAPEQRRQLFQQAQQLYDLLLRAWRSSFSR